MKGFWSTEAIEYFQEQGLESDEWTEMNWSEVKWRELKGGEDHVIAVKGDSEG